MPRSPRLSLSLHDYAGHAFAYELAVSLARRGIDIEYGWCATTNTPNGRLVDTDGLRAVPLGQGWTFEKYRPIGRLISEARLGVASARAIRHRRPTHVITCNMPVLSALCSWAAAISVGARRIMWFQDAQSEIAASVRGRRDPVALVARLLESLALRGAHQVVTISTHMRHTATRLGARPDRTVVLENWAPLHELPQHPRDNDWARAHHLDGTFTYLYSGTLARKHRPERLLELAAELDRTGDGRVVVISTGEGADHLRTHGAHLRSLTVLPYQPFDQLPLALASADVLLVLLEDSANASSVPSKTLSYLCAGRAVLGAMPLDNLSTHTVVERAEAGIVVAPADAAGFLDAARRLRTDTELRTRLAANGRRYAEATFGDQQVTDAFLAAAGIPAAPADGPTVTVVQCAMGGYRTAFVDELRARLDDRLTLAVGDHHIDPSLRTAITRTARDTHLANRFLFGRRLVFQHGYRRAIRHADVWVLELNPRIVTTWLAALEGRLRHRPVLLWGHHVGRRLGETGPRTLRRLQVRLAGAVLAYTDAEADAFRASYPGLRVHVAPNAIDRSDHLALPADGPRTDLVSIGRLVADKRNDLLVDGFTRALRDGRIPADARLLIVGDGPERDALDKQIADLGVTANVVLQPGTFDPATIDALYAHAVAAACGGYVGLNITQSLTRGVPFVYPRVANHSPEVSLAHDGVDAIAFHPNTPDAVADAIARVWHTAADHTAIQQAARRYTVEAMVDGFVDAIEASAVARG
jgi:glycosyltransferase involved in cell wall biosynthesis